MLKWPRCYLVHWRATDKWPFSFSFSSLQLLWNISWLTECQVSLFCPPSTSCCFGFGIWDRLEECVSVESKRVPLFSTLYKDWVKGCLCPVTCTENQWHVCNCPVNLGANLIYPKRIWFQKNESSSLYDWLETSKDAYFSRPLTNPCS